MYHNFYNSIFTLPSQKGFWEGVSGTIEHTELFTHIINHARNNQRHLVVTLLDLKNAFCEVDHNLLKTVLDYHHVPNDVINLVQNLYDNYCIPFRLEQKRLLQTQLE